MPRFGSFLLAGEQRDKITLTHRSTPAYNPIYGHFLKLSSVSLCSWANFIIRFPKQTSYSVTRTCTLRSGSLSLMAICTLRSSPTIRFSMDVSSARTKPLPGSNPDCNMGIGIDKCLPMR